MENLVSSHLPTLGAQIYLHICVFLRLCDFSTIMVPYDGLKIE